MHAFSCNIKIWMEPDLGIIFHHGYACQKLANIAANVPEYIFWKAAIKQPLNGSGEISLGWEAQKKNE